MFVPEAAHSGFVRKTAKTAGRMGAEQAELLPLRHKRFSIIFFFSINIITL